MKSFKTFYNEQGTLLNESSLKRVATHIAGRHVGIISAQRSENNNEKNNEWHDALKEKARAAGFGYIRMKGRTRENIGKADERAVDERSLMIIGHKDEHTPEMMNKHLTKWAKEHNQDSYIFKHKDQDTATLHGTKDGVFPGDGEKFDLGKFHPDHAPEYHSILMGRHSGAKNKEDAYGTTGTKRKHTFAFGQKNEEFHVDEFYFLTDKSFFSRPFPGEDDPHF